MKFKNKHLNKFAKSMQQQIGQMLAWPADTPTEPGKPYITERDGILSLHFDGLSVQSEMDIDMPDELVIGYTRAMMSFLLLIPAPERIAMIGLGGGSMAKYCYRHLPEADITVVEINPDVIALRNEFAVPDDDERFRVVLDDGANWVSNSSESCDILIVDGFDAMGLPEQLSSQRFYDDCFAALADDGILVVNLWGGYPFYNTYLSRIHTSFSDRILIMEASDSVNKIILALKNPQFPPTASTIRHHAQLLSLSHPVNFKNKSSKLIRALP